MKSFQDIITVFEEVISSKTLEKAVFSRPLDKSVKKTVAKLFKKSDDVFCQIERFTTDNKAHHENIPIQDAPARLAEMAMREYVQSDIFSKDGFCEILVSKKGHIHIADKRTKKEENAPVEIAEHNREKHYILDAKTHASFLSRLGVSDDKGRVFEKKRSKFKQINRFLDLLNDVYDKLPADGLLTVCDLCCGKSYLTFAVYYYLTEIKKCDVSMFGVDLKSDVIAYCESVARELDCKGLTFLCGDITAFSPSTRVDLVISLHACDIATDIVLDFAVRKKTRVVLSTPCCHHEMMRQLNAPALAFATKHSMLKQKLCDAATDALRGLKLEANGYIVDMPELIDAEETPKNLMIRAYLADRVDPAARSLAKKQYFAACEFLGVTPYLGLTQ